jgi:hypothetical protein
VRLLWASAAVEAFENNMAALAFAFAAFQIRNATDLGKR